MRYRNRSAQSSPLPPGGAAAGGGVRPFTPTPQPPPPLVGEGEGVKPILPLLLGLLGVIALSLALSPRAVARPALQQVTLSLSKTESADPVPAGHLLVYTLTYSNPTTETVTGVVLTDTLDPSVVYQAAAPEPTGGLPEAPYWEVGTLSETTGGQIVLTVTVPATLPDGAVLTNTATIAGDGAPPQTVQVTTTVAAPDLRMTKGDSPDPAVAGAPLTYTLRYTNAGSAPASGVVITDVLDFRVVYSSASPLPSGGTPTAPYWAVGDLPASASGQILVFVTVTTGLQGGTILTNVAHIGRDSAVPLIVTETTSVLAHGAPVSLSLAPPTAVISAGAPVTYTLTAHDAYGNPWDVTGAGSYSIDPAAGGIWAANRYTACVAGTWTVTATYETLFATATLTVTSGLPSTLSVSPKSATIAAGQVQTYTAASADLCANPIGDVTSGTAFTITPGAGGAWDGNRYTAEKDGTWTVTGTWGTLGDTAVLTVTNIPPTARAGGPYIAAEGSPILFDGSASTDPGNDITLYEWDFYYMGTFQPRATGITTTHAYTDNGLYTAALRVWDDNNTFGTDTTLVTVTNAAPVVDAGPDRQVNEGEAVPFTGTFTDPGAGDTHDILWTFGDGGSFGGALTPTHVYSEPGSFLVTLVVTDDDGGVGSDSLTVTVLNLPPTASAGGPYTGTAGVPVTLTGTGSDPGGGVLTYTWDLDFDGQYDDGVGATVQYTWTVAAVYTVALRVEDAQHAAATSTARVTIQPAALHHIVVSPDTATIQAGQSQTYTTAAYDAYGNWRGDVTTQTTFSILQGGHGGYWVSNVYVSKNPGTWTVVGTYSGISDTAVLTVLAPILNLVKADLTDPVDAGAYLTYTLRYTNTGNQTATGVVITDTLDGNVTYSGATPAPSGFMGSNPYWTLGSLPVNTPGQITMRVQVQMPLTNGTVLTNVAVIGCAQTTPVTAVQTTTVRSSPILLLTKTDGPDPVDAGAQLAYTLTYQNTGNEVAHGVVVTDVLDIRTLFAGSVPPSQGSGQTRYWSLGDLAPGAPATIRITATVQSPLPNGTVLTNSAWLDSDQTPPVSAIQTTTVSSRPVLTMTKRDTPDPIVAGEILYYTIVITNSGNENATGVVVTETYDANVSFVYANPPPQSGSGNRRWVFGSLPVGSPQTIEVVVRVASPLPAGTVLTNRVALDTDQTVPFTVTETTQVLSEPSLKVVQVDDPDPVAAGGELVYSIACQNTGTAPATGVRITDTYDSRVTFLSANPPPTQGNNVWAIGTLNPGGVYNFVVRVRVHSPLPNGTTLANMVTVSSNEAPPANFITTTQVTAAPRVTFSVADSPDPVPAGETLTYTLRYTNTGNANATGAVITATLDSRVVFSGASPPPAAGEGTTWSWTPGTIPGEGGGGRIDLWVQVTSPLTNGTVLPFQAELAYAEGPPLTATAQTTVSSAPVLSLTKSDGVTVVYAGDRLTYTLTVTNSGNENADGIVVTDTLPNYAAYLGCEPAASCQRTGDKVVFPIPFLPAPGVFQGRVGVQVDSPLAAGADRVVNRARMTAPSLAAPVEIEEVDLIGTRPDLRLAVTHKPSLFSPGKAMTFTVTYSNTGAMHAEGVVITAVIPAATVYVGDGWQPAGGRVYTRAVGTLPAGSTGPTVTLVISHVWQTSVGAEQFSVPFTIGDPFGDAQPADNNHTVPIGVPDLVIADFQVEPLTLEPNKPVTFTIGIWNRGTGVAWNPDNNGGFWVDVFTTPVPSYPCESYGFAYAGVPALAPGSRYTVTLPYGGFTAQEIQGIREFYARVDNHRQYPYGLVPESDETNNVAGPLVLRPYAVYLPLVCRGR